MELAGQEFEAAALWGSAKNDGYSNAERLQFALSALEYYGSVVQPQEGTEDDNKQSPEIPLTPESQDPSNLAFAIYRLQGLRFDYQDPNKVSVTQAIDDLAEAISRIARKVAQD